MIKVTRKANRKSNAHRIAGWMGKLGMTQIRIEGHNGEWEVIAESDALCLAKFCALEAKYEQISNTL